jgi:hypothetical protein
MYRVGLRRWEIDAIPAELAAMDFEVVEVREADGGPFTPNVYRMRRRAVGFVSE